ncbi:MAG: ABC transporter ATP-binding protein [Deltaproteobacteria bacterium]|jgi:molybdate/tungstate transport system ATP-binding protein|nr:ABC transporter ATP-binding protein [Deltaproteobacteria bacterium]
MIQIHDLSLDLDEFHLRHVNLTVAEGEYLVLLGPTGAGKTVLLECIVGLHRRHSGTIAVDGVDVTRLYPEERNIGYVPQDYALFPNMTVAKNLAYGLRARRAPPDEVAAKVRAMLAKLDIEGLSARHPATLSGGEKQRVALGRALLTEPHVLLLDEPLAALDENTRCELAAGLREIQRSVRGTFVHVCHNLEEALEVADRVAVIDDGGIVQVGTPEEILYRPACLFVAEFTRTRNLLPGRAEAGGPGAMVTLAAGAVLPSAVPAAGPIVASLRPERIRLLATGGGPVEGELGGTIVRVNPRPSHVEVEVNIGSRLVLHLGHGEASSLPSVGQPVRLQVDPKDVRLHPPPRSRATNAEGGGQANRGEAS